MASTITLISESYDGRYMKLECVQGRNPADNTSTITWTLSTVGGNSNFYSTGPTKVSINGTEVYNSPRTSYASGNFPAAKGSITDSHKVAHNIDGSKTITVSFSTAIYYSEVKTYSKSWTLDTVDRGAKITSFAWDNDESDIIVGISNPAGIKVSNLELYLSSELGDKIATRTINYKYTTSYTMTLTDAERAKVWEVFNTRKKTETHFFMVLITTIDGEEYLEAMLKNDCKLVNYLPSIDDIVFTITDGSANLTGSNTKIIKHISDVSYNVKTTTKKGATIQSYSNVCGSYRSNKATDTVVDMDGTTFTTTITDTRGSSMTMSKSFSKVDYIPLTCNSNAEIEIDGETTAKATVSVEGNYFNSSFGAVNNTLAIQIKTNIDDEWITYSNLITPTISGNTYKLVVSFYDLPYDREFKYQCRVIDQVDTVYDIDKTTTLMPVFDWSKNDFNFNVPVKINGDLEVSGTINGASSDYIVEQGTKSNWTYRKWNSGVMECWRRLQITQNVSSTWGSLYTSGSISSTNLTYPFAFTETPMLTTNLMPFGSGGILMASGNAFGSATQTGPLEIARGTSASGVQFLINYYAIGRWK